MDEQSDLGATIRAAAEELAAAEPITQEPIQEQAEPAPEAPEPASTEGRKRAPDGKFAKAEETSYTEPVQSAEPQEAPQTAPILPPASWKAEAKHKWDTIPPEVQQEVLRRERDIQDGLAQTQSKAERVNRFDALVAPHKEKLALNGIDEFQAVERLFAAQSYLERDPVNAILYLAQQYGVHPSQLAGQPAGQQGPQAPQYDQVLQPILQEVQTLKQTIAAQQQQTENARMMQLKSEIEAFKSDPAHMYFDNVQDEMALLLQAGKATTLSDAYDMAVHMHPNIRALVQADQAKKAEAKALEAQRAKAAQAKQASGSVSGAPGAGGSVPTNPNDNRSLSEIIRASAQEVSGRA